MTVKGKIELWSCGHEARSMCAECYMILARRAGVLAEEGHMLREELIEARRELVECRTTLFALNADDQS